jgi:hypothetical protein
MKLTQKYEEALKQEWNTASWQHDVAHYLYRYWNQHVRPSMTCCGTRELSSLSASDARFNAEIIQRAMQEKAGQIVYYNEYRQGQIAMLKEFGFHSMGLFRNKNTGNLVEGLYFNFNID